MLCHSERSINKAKNLKSDFRCAQNDNMTILMLKGIDERPFSTICTLQPMGQQTFV